MAATDGQITWVLNDSEEFPSNLRDLAVLKSVDVITTGERGTGPVTKASIRIRGKMVSTTDKLRGRMIKDWIKLTMLFDTEGDASEAQVSPCPETMCLALQSYKADKSIFGLILSHVEDNKLENHYRRRGLFEMSRNYDDRNLDGSIAEDFSSSFPDCPVTITYLIVFV